jgi:HAMP domain-containing protein
MLLRLLRPALLLVGLLVIVHASKATAACGLPPTPWAWYIPADTNDKEIHMPRTATIGPAVYERVNELVGEGKTRTEAFQAVASERGMNQGTVAANYYRTARSQDGTTKRPGTRARKATAAKTPSRGRAARGRASVPATADTDLGALANQIGELVQQLVRQVEERDRRLREVLG